MIIKQTMNHAVIILHVKQTGYLCVSAVPQHAVCSSELHHGEGGEHPAVQPLAPTHPHLTPEPTRPDQNQKPRNQSRKKSRTETAELKPRTLQIGLD